MGRQEKNAVAAVEQITPPQDGSLTDGKARLVGEFMLERLRESIMGEPVFQTLFGGGDDKTDPLQSNIYLNKLISYNSTVLPAWEFRFFSENSIGAQLTLDGRINSRILFPEKLSGDLNFHRKVALAVVRYFNSAKRCEDFLPKVSGLTEFGENLDIKYDLIFVHGGKKTPVITIGMNYSFDMRRFRLENECVDFDSTLDADLIKEAIYRLEISGDDEVTGKREVLIPESNI